MPDLDRPRRAPAQVSNYGTGSMPADQLALELMEQSNDAHGRLADLACELREAITRPATMRVVRLTAQVPIEREIGSGKSLGLLNPTGITIYLGVGGATARPGSSAVPVPANSLLVLPVSVDNVEIGADPAALAAGDAVVFAFIFPSVQAASLGALA